jgi:hypothetical protein
MDVLRCEARDGANCSPTVPRMQFYAIEIARNRNGLNDWICEKEKTGAEAAGGKS